MTCRKRNEGSRKRFNPAMLFFAVLPSVLLFFIASSCTSKRQNAIDSMRRTELLEQIKVQEPNSDTEYVHLADLYNALSYKLINYDHKKAQEHAQKALNLLEKKKYISGIVAAYCNMGIVEVRAGNFTKGIDYLNKALKMVPEKDYEDSKARCYFCYGSYYQQKAEYNKAMDFFLQSKEICEETGNIRYLANCYHGIGVLYFYDQQTYHTALENFKKSLALREKLGDEDEISHSNYSLGEVYKEMKNYAAARKYLRKCLDIAIVIENPYLQANAYQTLADIDCEEGNYREAKEEIAKSLELFMNIDEPFQVAESYRSLILIHYGLKEYKEAYNALEDALKIAREKNLPKTIDRIVSIKELEEIYQRNDHTDRYNEIKKLKTEMKSFLKERTMYRLAKYYEMEQAKIQAEERNTLLIIGVVFLLIVFFVFYRYYKKEQRGNRLLSQKSREIEKINKELFQQQSELESSNKNLAKLSEIGKTITAGLSAELIVRKVFESVNELMDASAFAIGIFNPINHTLDFHASGNGTAKHFTLKLSDKNRLSVYCFQKEKRIIVNDFAVEYKNYIDEMQSPVGGITFTSMIHLPLLIKGKRKKKIGVLTVQSLKKNAYSEQDSFMLENIATYAAIALDNALAIKEIESQARQLKEALEREKELGNLKDDFMYTLSHQYKTPLSKIFLAGQYLRDYYTTLQEKEFLEELSDIFTNIERMQTLMDKLLHYGKKFTPEYHDLEKVCRETITNIQQSGKGSDFLIKYSPKVLPIKAWIDIELIKILVENIIVNSINYSPKGSEIGIELNSNGHNAELSVRDHGRGIPSDYIKLQDKRFHRGSNTGDTIGTGLGLSIVERYVKLHDGKINYNSKLNVGTTITITLPLKNKIEKQSRKQPWRTHAEMENTGDRGR